MEPFKGSILKKTDIYQTLFVDFGYDWEVHPAFRWALQPDNLDDIFIL